MLTPEPQQPKRVLLLSREQRWIDAARQAAATLRMPLLLARSPEHAMVLLAGIHDFECLLLDAATTEPSALALIEMTCGEVESGVHVLMLGAGPPGLQAVAEPSAGVVAAALANPEAPASDFSGDLPLDEAHLVQSMRDGNVHVRFQPIVNIKDRSLMALEVLARLHGTSCGILPPHRFIPQIERAGLGADLLRFVTEEAFSQMGGLAGARLTLNLPLDVLNDSRTMRMLTDLRERAGVPASRIVIELTESQVVDDMAVLNRVVEQWRRGGYVLAIDDAGPALPNHRDMFRLPFEWVKLDKSVLSQALTSDASHRYMADTVAYAHRANLSVIAEGVEHQAAWDKLAAMDVQCGQGFMIARPLPAEAVPVWRRAWELEA